MNPEEFRDRLRDGAVVCINATPFRGDGDIDFEGLRENIRFLVDECRGKPLVLTPCGSTSEFYTLSPDERERVIKTVVDEANGKLLVVPGTAHSGTRRAVEHSRVAEDLGADGVMVVMPYYHVPNEEGMYQHYKAVAEGINIGVMIYNNPDTSKCYIKPPLMARMADIPGIAAVKENTRDLYMYHQHMKMSGDKIPLLCGVGEFWFALEALLGCPGFISSMANYVPEIPLELLDAAREKNFDKVGEMIDRLHPFFQFGDKVAEAHGPSSTLIGGPDTYMYIGVMKEAMNIMGLSGGIPRLPLLKIDEKEKKELAEVLTKIGAR